ncbi:Coiled-coil domain-containing protein 42-like protein [Trichoplax sp. H2]|nr:Coiled-coil domain-containing protein 42-like protein [Trichoplax sp. H2]|eukprot:RDD42880.1 Coiled-coil domain-containing protein 42-like protein [Trichoplax sp. H2]
MTVNLEEYFRTTFEDKLLVKMPEREDDHLTPATRLLEKRREMSEVEQALAAQKEEFQMKMESLQQRREELERKEYQLKESLLKFDKFLKENDSKRTRALKKAHEERDLIKSKDKDIIKLIDETQTMIKQRDKMQKKLLKYILYLFLSLVLTYQAYLEKVLEKTEEYSEIREITARFDTLVATYDDLIERERKNQESTEVEKGRLLKYKEEKNNEVMYYNNKLANLQTQLEKTQSEAAKWESRWTFIKNTAAKKTLLLGRVKMATHNLYTLVNKHLKQTPLPLDQTVLQLDKIQLFIMDLTQITQDIKRSEQLAASIAAKQQQQQLQMLLDKQA